MRGAPVTGLGSRLGFLAVAAVLVGAVAMVLWFRPAGDAFQVYVPEGYVTQVNQWIDDGHLTYDCASQKVSLAENLGPAERNFYRHSYLQDDVEAWNAGDRRAFLYERRSLRGGGCEGELLEADANHHKQRLPGYVAKTWKGSIFLRPASGGITLTSGERTLEVLPTPWDRLPLPSKVFEEVDLLGEAGGARSPQLALRVPPTVRAFATLTAVGDDPVLEVLEESPELSLDSCRVPLGWRLRLGAGDVVRAHGEDRLDERFLVETGERASLVSSLTEVNGEPRRRNFPRRLAMAQDVAYAVDAVVGAAEVDRKRDDFDVHLTLDPFLTAKLEEVLAGFAERYGKRLPRVAVTVLEPETGRLLALPSYPGTPALKEAGLQEATKQELLRRNHNFLAHPVGSATKPFLAAAALATEPRLASLRVPCTPAGEPESLLGYDMGSYNQPGDCQGAGEDGLVDLEEFLELSSNRYMLYMGLLAMADWKGGYPRPVPGAEELPADERYLLGSRILRAQPFLPMVRYDDDRPGDGQTPLQEVSRQSGLAGRFATLFDQGVEYRQEGMVSRLDLDLWTPVLRAAESAGALAMTAVEPTPRPRAALTFSPVTPEAVNLRLNLAQQLRQDLYTVLLGNGNNRWSNVQLAEALARLMTGRRVEARLVERVDVPPDTTKGTATERLPPEVLYDLAGELSASEAGPSPLADVLPDRLRERILAGMRRVVESPHGTAQQVGAVLEGLNRRAPDGVEYRGLAKTGTPTLGLSTVRNGPVEPAPGAIEVYSGNRQVKSGVLVLVLEREGPSEDGTGVQVERLALSLFVDSQGGSEQAVDLASSLLPPLVEARWPRDWMEAGSGG